MSSQHAGMLSPPKSPSRVQAIDASSQSSKRTHYRQKQVVDGDVVGTYETLSRRHQLGDLYVANQTRSTGHWPGSSREQELQAAMELPSSVLIVQGLRGMMNSDEPLYDVMDREQKKQLRREFLMDVGVRETDKDDASRKQVNFPPSPPVTPRPDRSLRAEAGGELGKRFCDCCKHRCL